jgi:hypothetical protein
MTLQVASISWHDQQCLLTKQNGNVVEQTANDAKT